MNSIVNLVGGHLVIGALITVLAGIAFVAWDYLRLQRSARWLSYALIVRRIAITLTVIALILIGSRFVAVVSSHGGV